MTMPDQMSRDCCPFYREEDWVDLYVSGKPYETRIAMLQHKETCAYCRGAAAEWEHLLRADEDIADGNAVVADVDLMPSPSVKRSLIMHVRKQGLQRRVRSFASSKKRWMTAAATGFVLIICLMGLSRLVHEPANQRSHYVEKNEPQAMQFMSDPHTASYQVHPSSEELGEGYVWFNDDSSEVLVMLEGMLPSESHDVQAWAVNERGRENLGLLHHAEAGRSHLYIKKQSLANIDIIVLTVEPLGGSENPTTPDAFIIRLHHRSS
ncbi:anti-sigma-K factor RskA [Paenibacillus taihuensis]|uniref:Anti-sigma-K factor RskA n=1 Tax=Paenibacillus taihuensis TaxID=1156355 RepID=A0A3D9SCP8_9BACL|nr:anti-sigma factor [Paenibacillus taihuensis]REE89098.1 anti-sigma-K factor RskA [Paenibacillus taihuensis]